MMDTLDIEKFVSVNKRILKIVGLYPINFIRYSICLLCMSLIVIPELFEIYFNRKNIKVILETSSVLLTIILAILKSMIWVSKKKTTELIDFLMSDYWRIAISSGDSKSIYQYARSARRVTVGYSLLIFNALLVFFSLPLTELIVPSGTDSNGSYTKINFPFIAKYPAFCYQSPPFEVIYISQMLATGICGMMILGTDTMVATAIFHTCGHFSIIQTKLEKLDFSEKQAIIENNLNNIIIHHQIVIRFADTIEKIFSPMMLLQVLASSFIICLVGFQVNSTLSTGEGLVEYFSYLMMALFQLLIFCWPGDELVNQSSMINNAAYSTNWSITSDRIKKNISFIIFRSQKPSFLSAGKFHLMKLESFSTVCIKFKLYHIHHNNFYR